MSTLSTVTSYDLKNHPQYSPSPGVPPLPPFHHHPLPHVNHHPPPPLNHHPLPHSGHHPGHPHPLPQCSWQYYPEAINNQCELSLDCATKYKILDF